MKLDRFREFLRLREFDRIKPRYAMAFLYDANELYRFRGAEALGYLCRGRKAREFMLRLFWHLSDESGAYCIGAPLGIAEIGRNDPKEFETFKNKFVSLLDNWEIKRKYVAYGIGRLAGILDDAYPNPVKKLLEVMEELKDNPNFIVYAIWALGMLEASEALEIVERFVEDRTVVSFYNGNDIVKVEVGKIARATLERLG